MSSMIDDFADIVGEAAAGDEEVRGWLDTGFQPLNKILSGRYDGGIGYGRLYEIYGPSSSGKTIIAMNVMIEAQKAGGAVILVDFERAFMVDLAIRSGLDTTRFIHMHPKSWEEGMMKAMQVAEKIRETKRISPNAPILLVTDSIASAIPQSVLTKELTEQTMNDTTALARATSATLKIVAARAKDADLTCLFLNQIRLKPGIAYGDPTTTPGGSAMEFYASGRLSIGRKKLTSKTEGGDKEFAGQRISIKCVKSKHTRPFQTTELDFMFREDGSGYFDVVGSMIDHLCDNEILKKSGARITWTDGKSYFRAALIEKIENEGLQAELTALLK